MTLGEIAEKPLERLVRNLQPAGIKELIEPKLRFINRTWQDYIHNSRQVLGELAAKGLVVVPDLRLPEEYRRFKFEEGGIFPSQEYAHLEQPYRDAWQRFSEARLEAGPNKVVLITPENNIFPNYPRMQLSKNHHLVTTPRYDSIDEAVVLMPHAMEERLRGLKMGDIRVGLDFRGITSSNRTFRVMYLSDFFIAQLMDRTLPQRLWGDFIGEVTFYCDTDDIWTMGGLAIVKNVPSLTKPGETYIVTLHHIPLVPRRNFDRRRNSVVVTPEAIGMSYDFRAEDTCPKEVLWTAKYHRRTIQIFNRAERKGDEVLVDRHAVFAYLRMLRTARWQLEGEVDPGRKFVVLPMFPELSRDTLTGFEKMYGLRFSESGHVKGGVLVEDHEQVVEDGSQRERLVRYTLPQVGVNFNIALHNLVALTKDPLVQQRPRLVYEQRQLL
ncbi:hypothetical protein HYY73_01080 [Candidatus Woesearchaeota archaeon]|nr:hypothetical protein [Candidatus Woesearchaeota archaeon]